MVRRRLLMLVLGFVALGQLYGQPQESRNDPAYDSKVPVNLVLVPVSMEDSEGNLIRNLGQNDFELSENGTSQKISYFSVDPSPLSVAFLIDRTVDEPTQQIFKKNMLALVEAFNSFDEMAFHEFLDGARKLQDFTFRKDVLLKPIGEVNLVPCRVMASTSLAYAPRLNTSFLDNAISVAAHDLERRGAHRRKVIFVVSNGATSAAERQSFAETRRLLIQNSIAVYGIGAGNSLLFPWKTRGFAETYQRISETARNQYVLGYVPGNDLKDG